MVMDELSESRQLSKETLISAIESALAAAYKREYAKPEQMIRANFDTNTGKFNYFQAKKTLDKDQILPEGEEQMEEDDDRVRFNSERHISIEDAKRVQVEATAGEEILFPLEAKTDFSRIAAQAAKQAITQKLHDAERDIVIKKFENKEGTIVSGTVQRMERGNVFIDLGRTVAILPFSEQIRGENFRQGEMIRAYVLSVDSTRKKGGFVRLTRSSAEFIVKLFEQEVPEMAQGVVTVKEIVRESGSRTKLAVASSDTSVDPVGALVGQRGVRVLTIKSELNGEQIDIIEYSGDKSEFVEEALSPAEILGIKMDGDTANVDVAEAQIPVAIGRGGQNLRLAAKLVELNIAIKNPEGKTLASSTKEGEVEVANEFRGPGRRFDTDEDGVDFNEDGEGGRSENVSEE